MFAFSFRSVGPLPCPALPALPCLCCAGVQLKLFQSVIPVFRFEIPTSLFLMPYLVHNVLAHGTDAARQGVQQEIQVGAGAGWL